VTAFGHDQALAWDGEWADVDAVVVDAADEGRSGDQFPGVAVVHRIRSSTPGPRPLVIVVTGHYLHDGLRHRMAAAGADFYFLRSELRTPEALIDVVLHPEHHRRGVPRPAEPGQARILGLGPGSDIESFLGWVDTEGLGPWLSGDQGGVRSRSRRWSRVRRDAAAAGGIQAVNLTTGDRPQGQQTPSIRQLARLWEWAARIRPPHP
jgi:CheY-like chemotaxis protein